eukprot:CAMPEP_0195533940 /NCGR_PEP_ID=MMETSP0794_2-20130614/41513_1 /TAXON_ID=515487 /ORGANISM="Stephanopyxis turris, Strain CCMP 815" /LENGTH=138 /DNA_ID=CAMNT_0040666641 /DNA_START=15 /DNA_END=428 /DNA_ORIENTATION=-
MLTPEIYHVASLFDESHHGRAFAIFRHPIDRVISTFNYIAYADPLKANVTLEEYARSDVGEESNWMVRMITNNRRTEVTREDLEVAKEFIRKKVLVGLLSEIEASVERFEKFFHWRHTSDWMRQEMCRDEHLYKVAYG